MPFQTPIPLLSCAENNPATDPFATLLTVAFTVIFLAWLGYDLRESRRNDWRTHTSVFYCLKCRHLYSILRRPKTAPCPKCGFTNPNLRF
ncbi:MAG: hypothetical protein LBG65_08270 [Puniceicoccales bacterium]|jgi:hypothetical protein|nr:hypothetical protein [Puniceicoccales bacterium]